MRRARLIVLATPFVIAFALNVLVLASDHLTLRREHIAGLCFLFGTPWAWLLDQGWFGNVNNQFAFFAVILWVPAMLYSASLWILVCAVRFARTRSK